MKVFKLLTCLNVLSTCELVGDSTVDGMVNKEDMTRKVAKIMMYHFSRNFFQQGSDMLW